MIIITLHTSSMGDGTKVNTIIIMDTLGYNVLKLKIGKSKGLVSIF